MHAKGNTLDELVADAVAKKRQGFTAIRFSPFAPDYHLRKSFEEGVSGCAYVRPDVCLCMGLNGSKKVAEMAEAHHVKVIPHNPLSPISTAACVQLDACIPNFALQEYTGESDPPKRDMVVQPLELKDGYLEVPDAPGLGIELNDTALARLKLREVVTEPPIGRDGSVQDW